MRSFFFNYVVGILMLFLFNLKLEFAITIENLAHNNKNHLFNNSSLEYDIRNQSNSIYEESPCDIDDSPFTDCISLNPKLIDKKSNREIRYHSSLLYLANYDVEDNNFSRKEKVLLKKSVKFHSLKFKRYPDEDGLDHELDNESYMDNNIDKDEGEIMRYLYEDVKYAHMPKLIDPNWNNMGWIVMSYYDGISLQEFYEAIYKDIDDIKIRNDYKFQSRMILKKGIIYKELNNFIENYIYNQNEDIDNEKSDIDANDAVRYDELSSKDKKSNWFFNLLISQYNAISHIYVDLLKKGVIHCNPSPSSIMIKKGTLGIHPTDIIFVDYSQSVKWNIETSQIFFSDIKKSCIPDLRPILSFLLADFELYIPLSYIDVTFFGKPSLAPINVVSTIEDSIYSGQCIDYNNLLRDYYNTNFHCKDLLMEYSSSQFNYIDCNTQLPSHSALPYNFRVFHFCQKTCGVCNKECESLVSIMNTEIYEDSNSYNDILKGSLIERLFKACKTNLELLSQEKLYNHWNNEKWSEKGNNKEKDTIENTEISLLGCKLCIKHQNILQNILIYYELPQVLLYPNIDLFIGNINILINSHLNIQNSFKNYLISLNNNTFKDLLSGNLSIITHGLKGNLINRWKDIKIRSTLTSLLLIGNKLSELIEFNQNNDKYNDNFLRFKQLNLKDEFNNTPTGLLYYKIIKNEFMLININIIKQAFITYTIKGFSSKYKQRVLEMLKIYSLKLLPNSLRSFPIFETNFKENNSLHGI